MKPWLKMLGLFFLIVLVVGGIWGYNLYTFLNKFKAAGIPKETVTSIIANNDEWQNNIHALANIRAIKGADIVVEAAGVVDKIMDVSSTDVKKGATILTLRANEDRAKLASLKANAALAVANKLRDQEQFSFGAISKSQMDSSNAQKAYTQAAVAEQAAKLAKKNLSAPFAGSLGIITVSEGEWLAAGTHVVSLQALESVYAEFTLPQTLFGQLKKGNHITFSTDALAKKTFTGTIDSIDTQIDSDTRTFFLRATIPNTYRELLPGMFGKIEAASGEAQSLITLPRTAIVYNPYGESVFLIIDAKTQYENKVARAKKDGSWEQLSKTLTAPTDKKQKVVTQVFVKTGNSRGDQISILSGINVGDEIVTSGQLKLKNGTHIKINNKFLPANSANPIPEAVY